MAEVTIYPYASVHWDEKNNAVYIGEEGSRYLELRAGDVYTKNEELRIKLRAYIGFDILSSIPDISTKNIISAKLYIYINSTSSNILRWRYSPEDLELEVFPPTGMTIATGLIPDYIALNDTEKWYELDVKSQLEESLGLSKLNLCFHISEYEDAPLATDTGIVNIASRWSDNKPYLVVTYHNIYPYPPTNLLPASETKLNSQTIRFSWTYHGTHDEDTQSKFDLQWSSNGGATWNTITQATSNQYYDMPANTLPVGDIIWRVRTYAFTGVVGEYSEQAAFASAGKPDAPVLTKPDATENTSTPLITWTGAGQAMYQAQVLQGETVIWDSGEVASISGQAQVGTALADGASYTAKVRIKNKYDLWSDWASKAFTVDFELPNKPEINIVKDLVRFSSRINILNPTPDSAGGFAYNEIYRREVDGSWMRIVTGIARDSTYEDCAMKSGQPYEYKIRAVGTYGYMDSDIKFSDTKVMDSQLASLTDKILYVPLKYDPQRTISIGLERTLMKFAGRPQSVTEFGEHIDKGLALSFVIESWANVEALIELVESAETLLFRDSKGRKIYCTIGSLDIEELENYWTVSFAIAETSHQEAV